MRRIARVLLAASCVALLGGCQIMGPRKVARAEPVAGAEAAPAGAVVAVWTAAGRTHLQAQRNGLAIEAFNRAIAQGEPAAPALNGLGVAYSRIGRADVAYRFFSQAVRAEPENPVFARNLVRLTNSPDFTLARMQAALPRAAARPAAAPAVREPGRLYREGNRQFTLVTRPEPTASTRPTPAMPRVAARSRKPVGMEPVPATQPAQQRSRTVSVPGAMQVQAEGQRPTRLAGDS